MKFIDQNGDTILDVVDTDVVRFERPKMSVVCVNLAEGLRSLRRLKTLDFCPEGQDDLEALRGLGELDELCVSPIYRLNIMPIATCTGLRRLCLQHMEKVDLSPLAALKNVESLLLVGTTTHLDAVGSLTRLKSLWVHFNKRVSLKWFADLSNIEDLSFVGSRLFDFDMFRHFPKLKKLGLGNTNIETLDCLAHSTSIETLDLGRCRKLRSLDGIERLTGLATLHMADMKTIPSIRPLAALRHLRSLYMRETRIEDGDLSALTHLPELEEVVLMDVSEEHFADVASRLPHCRMRAVGKRMRGAPFEVQGEVRLLRDLKGRNAESVSFRIEQDLTGILGVETNDDADARIRHEMERRSPAAMKELTFDTKGGAFVVRSSSFEAVRLVSGCINDAVVAAGGPREGDAGRRERVTAACQGEQDEASGEPGTPFETLGEVTILHDLSGDGESAAYRITQDLTGILRVETNDDAEERIQDEMERKFPDAMKDLEFDSEGEAFVVRTPSLDAIRSVARCINDMQAKRARGKRRGATA